MQSNMNMNTNAFSSGPNGPISAQSHIQPQTFTAPSGNIQVQNQTLNMNASDNVQYSGVNRSQA